MAPFPAEDQSISQLLDESKRMIRKFEELTRKDGVAQISADVQRETLASLEQALEPISDAVFDLFVDEEAMKVTAEFRPSAGGGQGLALATIEASLINKGVVFGLRWEAIRQALDACNLDFELRRDVVIAEGMPAVAFVPAHYRLLEKWQDKPSAEETDVAIDFKAISPFLMAQKGELIAAAVADAFGSHGTDVLGRPLPFPTEATPTWTAGENVTQSTEGLVAGLDGRLFVEPPQVRISPILELDQGVDYKTGNIHFHGEVFIKGKISSGFIVEAGGGITGTDTLDAFQMKAGGDINTPGGIIGNGDGRVEVAGQVTVKFLEHLYLLAQGDVRAETCVLNSIVKTRGRLTLGEKGILAGGQVHSLHGADVFQIGTATGPRTELFLGLDFVGMEKILWIRERSKEIHGQLKKVDAALPYAGQRLKDLEAAAKKLRMEIVQLTDTARAELLALGQDEEASLVVRGSVFPGTQIEICHVQFLVNQKLSGVKFTLDKRKGTIAVDSLKTTTPSASPKKKH